MQAQLVSNSQFSTPLSWFDQGYHAVSDCLNSKVTRVFLSALAGALLALGAVALTALSLPISIAIVTSAAAICGSIPLLIDWALSRPVVYQELEQVALAYAASPQMLETINKVRQFLAPPQIHLEQSYDYYHFHHNLTVLTEEVKVRDDLREIWRTFLNRIEERSIEQPDDLSIPLTTEMEKERLANRQIEVITDRLNLQSPLFEQELNQVVAISNECFGRTWGNAQLRELVQRPNVQVHLARQRDTQKILGYIAVQQETDQQNRPTLHVTHVGRRAEACSLGVAHRIFQQIFAQPVDGFASIFLEVRESNEDAIALYGRWGFAQVGQHNNYYSYPTENALVMQRQAIRPIA